MTILLQSKNKYHRLASLDIVSGRIEWRHRNKDFDPPIQSLQGSIGKIGKHILCLYKYDDVLHFRVDTKDFELTKDVTIGIENLRCRRRRLSILKNGREIFEFTYFRPINPIPLSLDPTPHIEEEDFDFGLFVYNVANDSQRRAVLFQAQS